MCTLIYPLHFVCKKTDFPMAWSTADSSEHTEVEVIKSHLTELGFPEYVLNDLTPKDIAACDGALQVVVDITDEPVNDGRTVTTEYRTLSFSCNADQAQRGAVRRGCCRLPCWGKAAQ